MNANQLKGNTIFKLKGLPTGRGYLHKFDGGHLIGGRVETIQKNDGNIKGYKIEVLLGFLEPKDRCEA